MRIQHNIMAMSAYRNYTNNVSAMKKNLEKLSSGYKINRAGDDAAGLAISEKMRAQITGLETAQKNAKDGISLVQTAEGALTEVHDMLNRMVELATQSANGTYDNTTDRNQMQKEIEQLKSEINRIADSSNFNGIKLLNGDMDSTSTETINATTFAGETTGLFVPVDDKGTDDEADDVAFINGKGNCVQGWGLYTHKEAAGSGKTSFEVRLSDKEVNNLKPEQEVTIKFQLKKYTDPNVTDATTNAFDIKVKADENGKITGQMLADAVAKHFKDNVNKDGTVDLTNRSGYKVNYNVTAKDGAIVFEMSDKGYETAKNISKDSTEHSFEHMIFDANYNIKFDVQYDELETIASAGSGAAATAAGYTKQDGSALEDADVADGSTIYKNGNAYTVATGDAANTLDIKRTATVGDGWTDNSTSVTKRGSAISGTQLADGLVAPREGGWGWADFKDGAGIRLGDTNYVFALSDDTMKAKFDANTKVVDLRDLVQTSGADKGKLGYTSADEALHRVVDAASDNKMWSVQLSNNGNMIAIRERNDYNGNGEDGRADLTTREGIEKQVQMFTKATGSSTVTEATGKALTLQIGDTAEDFNQLKVNIGDMHAASIGIGDVSVANQEDAAKAVDAIKAAINKVSDVRGTLGATQNRLDHTINNLSVMTENIQDAESTIRDVDVAEEMMAYTKNNILIQSAQAMLAQANQVPQGVLQLLQ